MTVEDYYCGAIVGGHESLRLAIEFFVFDEKILNSNDDGSILEKALDDYQGHLNELIKSRRV